MPGAWAMRNQYGLPIAVDEYELAERADRRTRAIVFLCSVLFFIGAVALLAMSIYKVR